MPHSGALRDIATFQEASYVADGGGGGAESWANLFDPVHVEIVERRGSEALEAGRLESSNVVVLKVRSTSDTRTVAEKNRVLIGGVAHQIRSITNPGRRKQWLEMILERGVAV